MLNIHEFNTNPRRTPRKTAPGRVVRGVASVAEERTIYLQDWRARNRGRIQANTKRWRRENPDRVQQHAENYRAKNPEGFRVMHLRAAARWRAKRRVKAAAGEGRQ